MKVQPTKILSGMRISLPKSFVKTNQLKQGDFVGLIVGSSGISICLLEVAVKE